MLKSLDFYLHAMISLCLICSFQAHYYLTLYLQATYFPQHHSIANHSDVNHGTVSHVTCHVSSVTSLGSGVSDGVVLVVLLRAVAAVYCRHDVEDVVRCNSENNLEANCQV